MSIKAQAMLPIKGGRCGGNMKRDRVQEQRQLRIVHVGSDSGHRRAYRELFEKEFDMAGSVGSIGFRECAVLCRADKLLFGTIDDDYLGFFLVSVLRAIFGRRTVGIFIRPQTCFDSGLSYTLKKCAFMALRRVSPVTVCTIVPFSVEPRFAMIADEGLIDPQFWDLPSVVLAQEPSIITDIRVAAAGRAVMAFLGTAHEGKGIQFFRDLVDHADWPIEKLLPVIAGKFPTQFAETADALKARGAFVVDRVISDEELLAVNGQADMIWTCYQPGYDQSSGIFGRAVQFGRRSVVRGGSVIARFARMERIECVEIDYGNTDSAVMVFKAMNWCKDPHPIPTLQWRENFLAKINGSL
jgi:hypothetical protein